MSDRQVLSEQEAYELLAFLISSTETSTHEPHRYGSLRLLDAASLLMGSMIENASGEQRAWLEQYQQEINAKKGWSTRDWEGFKVFIRSAAADLAREMKRRDLPAADSATGHRVPGNEGGANGGE
jgi:hypothetical protein